MYRKTGGRSALLLVFVVWICGCAAKKPTTIDDRVRDRYGGMDRFDVLLLRAGVDLTEFPARNTWTVEEANDLAEWLRFKLADGNMSSYGPRVLAAFLLEEGIKTGKAIPRHQLLKQLNLHGQLAVLTPEGHLVEARTGTVLLCVGHLRIQNGVPQAGGFKVDAFYTREGNTFHEAPNLAAPAIFTHPAPKQPSKQIVDDAPH